MKKFSSIPGIFASVAVHVLALGALLLIAREEDAVSPSAADPILLMLGGEDPNKDAGLVGRERGVARGTQDGNLFDPGEFSQEKLNAIKAQNERIAAEEAARAEREQRVAEDAAKKAAEEKAARERAKREQAKPKPVPGKSANDKKSAGKSAEKPSDGKKVSISEILKAQKSGGGKATPAKGGNSGKRITDVRVGGGKPFGSSTGTGGNGGDGGKRVANAQMLYVEAVAKRFEIHFQNVVAQNPVSIPKSVVVDARFSVDSSGNIRFIEVLGNQDSQIRNCIRKTFERAFPNRFQRPPNGEAFTGCIRGISFALN